MHPATQRLAAMDEANLVIDHAGQVNVFLVAGLLAPGGFVTADGTADMPRLRDSLSDTILALPALCRTAVASGRRHRWAPTEPDLEHHIRLVEPVDGRAGLEQLCAELMTRPLARDRPAWEILIVPGATAGGAGVVLRVHHAVADGVAAVAIVHEMFDAARPADASSGPLFDAGEPRIRWSRRMRRLDTGLKRIATTLGRRDVGATVLLGRRSEHRGVRFLHADLDGIESRARRAGATLNDALLAATASGFRAALAAAGESIPSQLPVSVPVALRRRGSAGNQVGVMLVRLPLGEADPDECLRRIAAQTGVEKSAARRQGTLELMRGPLGAQIMDRVARRQRLVAGFVTNVRGPDGALRLAGAPVLALWPVAVLAGNVRLGVAALSYSGVLSCGIHFDAASVPGDAFAAAMRDELERLGG